MLCDASVIIEYDRRRPGLPNAPLDIKYDNSSIEQSTAIALNMNIDCQSSDKTITYSRAKASLSGAGPDSGQKIAGLSSNPSALITPSAPVLSRFI